MTKKILWIDDQIDGYSEFISGFEKHGLQVIEANSVDNAITTLKKENVDLILLDLKMPDKNGFEFLRKKVVKSKIPICVFSSYLHLKEYQKQLGRLRSNLAVLDKDLPRPNSEAFGMLAEKIKRLIATPPNLAPNAFERNVRTLLMDLDPFEIEFTKYLTLPNRIKSWLRNSARSKVEHLLKESFKEGYDWVLLCGDINEIVLKTTAGTPPPSNDTIMQIAMDRNRVPYQFSAPDHVDDIFSGGCAGPSNIQNYPTVTIKIGGQKHDFHFDTGSPYTFLSYEELEELGVVDSGALSTQGQRGVYYYEYINQKVQARLVDQKSNGVKVVSVNAKLVKNWVEGPYVVFCPSLCKSNSETEKRSVCKNRKGLIGRNLIFENDLSITVCGSSNKSSIKKNRRQHD